MRIQHRVPTTILKRHNSVNGNNISVQLQKVTISLLLTVLSNNGTKNVSKVKVRILRFPNSDSWKSLLYSNRNPYYDYILN